MSTVASARYIEGEAEVVVTGVCRNCSRKIPEDRTYCDLRCARRSKRKRYKRNLRARGLL